MKAAGGFAKIWRSVYGHAALRDVAEEACFTWMVGKAAWQPARVKFRDKPIHLKRGQLAISQRQMAAGLRWSLGTFQRFIDRLTAESMVDTHTESGVTVITICNYDIYQAIESPTESPGDTPRVRKPSQSRVTEQEKEEVKKDSPLPPKGAAQAFLPADWKPPAIAELSPKAKQCAEQWPRGAYDTVAEGFALYWQSRNRKMADWHKTWCGWIIREHWRVMQEARRRPASDGNGDGKKLYQRMADERAGRA